MDQHGQFILSKQQQDEIKSLLDAEGIKYSNVELFSIFVDVAKIALYNIPWVAVASVITAFIVAKSKRKVMVVLDDDTRFEFTGYSIKEIGMIKEMMTKEKQYEVHFSDDE